MPPQSWPVAIWLFLASTALHNLEEAIWLPGFEGFTRLAEVSPFSFRFAAAALTLIFVAAGTLAVAGGAASPAAYAICGLALAMAVNVVFPHLVLTIGLRRYMPGLVTGLALVLPSGVFLIVKSLREDYIDAYVFALAGPATALAALALTVVLLWIGGRIEERIR